MLQVPRAILFRFVVVLGVVVAVRQAQPALIQLCDHHRRIVGVLHRTRSEQYRAAVHQLQFSHQRRQFARRLQLCDGPQLRLQRFDPALFHHRLIHAGRVIIADFARHLVSVRGWRRCLFKNRVQKVKIVLVQFRVDVPGRLICRNRIVLLPASGRKMIEVHAWVRGAIERTQIQARRVGKRRP